ncbi:hypothetical protein NQ318_016723 [Aromia moschata]|uniref:Uncharacterized protein n=1 Tax=Aromia moschata TaxID=1265417 RepID=A0AAV8XWZ9_9CUCU|nr:hypothetical protein NQ318_016723 [Aromia moschata]
MLTNVKIHFYLCLGCCQDAGGILIYERKLRLLRDERDISESKRISFYLMGKQNVPNENFEEPATPCRAGNWNADPFVEIVNSMALNRTEFLM